MPPPLIHHVYAPALPAHCEPSSSFLTAISSYLHVCIPTPLAFVSSLLGMLSIVSWLFAQLPQIYKNFVLQSTSGLSIFFLVEWCLGDTANLVGAIFTRQADWQVVIASYYVVVDVVLVFQYFWYIHRGQSKGDSDVVCDPGAGYGPGAVLEGVSLSDGNDEASILSSDNYRASEPKDVKDGKRGAFNHLMFGQSPSYSNEKFGSFRQSSRRAGSGSILPVASPRTLILTSMLCAMLATASPVDTATAASRSLTSSSPTIITIHSNASMSTSEIIGRIASWLSTFLYLGSRPPQLYKNFRRKSTAGLSPLLFAAAFCGNLCYSVSLLTNPNAWSDFPAYGGGGWSDAHGNDRMEYIGRTIPFFLGAAGVLFFDGLVGVQFLIYGSRDVDGVRVRDKAAVDEDALLPASSEWHPPRHRRWSRRVSGWMRGWIPSVSPTRRDRYDSQNKRRGSIPESRTLLDASMSPGQRYGAISSSGSPR